MSCLTGKTVSRVMRNECSNREKKPVAFDFAFSATKEELEKEKIQIPVEKRVTLEDETVIHFKSLTLTRLDSRIEAELEKLPEGKKTEILPFLAGTWMGGTAWEIHSGISVKILVRRILHLYVMCEVDCSHLWTEAKRAGEKLTVCMGGSLL